MKNLWFENYEDLVCDVVNTLGAIREHDEYKYEEARRIIKELVCFGYDLRSIDIHDKFSSNYDAEYIISVCNIDGEDEIWCEPMLRDNGYILDESTIIYIFDNCSSKVIPYCNGEVVYEVNVGEDDFEDKCDCTECCGCYHCDDNELANTSTEKYFVNDELVSKDVFNEYDKLIRSKIKEIEEGMSLFRQMMFGF